MNILITGASTRISRLLAPVLAESHSVKLTDRVPHTDLDNFVLCDLGHDAATNDLVHGMDVVIHSGQVDNGLPVSPKLDGGTRCVYNLVRAAAEEEVPRLIFLSSLSVIGRYDEALAVTERWRPAPTTETDVLCFHLGEFICREFAREQRIEIVCLRLGDLVTGTEASVSNSALLEADAVQAVKRALTADVSDGYAGSRSYWGLFHIQSEVLDRRFLTTAAENGLGFEPSVLPLAR